MKFYPERVKNPKTYNSRADRLYMEGGIGVMHCHFCRVKSPLKMSWHGRTQCRVCGMVWWIGNTVRPAAIHEVIRRQYVWNFFCRMDNLKTGEFSKERIWMGSDLINEHTAVLWRETRGSDWNSSFECHHGIITRSNHDAKVVLGWLATDLLLYGLGGTSMEDVPEWAQIYLRNPYGLLTHTRLVRCRRTSQRREFRDVLPFGVTGIPKGFWHYNDYGRWSRSTGTGSRRPTSWDVSEGLGTALGNYVGQLRDLESLLDTGADLSPKQKPLARENLLISQIPGFELSNSPAEVRSKPVKHKKVGLTVGGDLLGGGNNLDVIDGFELVPPDSSEDFFLRHSKSSSNGGRLDSLSEKRSDGPTSDGRGETAASGG